MKDEAFTFHSMADQVRAQLRPVWRRQRRQAALQAAVTGLVLGSLAAVACGAMRVIGLAVGPPLVLSVLLTTTLLGFVVGYVRVRSWRCAAAAIDAHYGLKDRAVTALSFMRDGQPARGAMHQLQIADTLAHLQAVDAQAVVPLRVPRLLPVALAGLLAALALLWVPPRFAARVEAESTPAAGPQVQAEADRLQETMLNDLQQLAETHRQPELDALLAQLKPLVTRLQEPAIGQADALATLSEMQAAVADCAGRVRPAGGRSPAACRGPGAGSRRGIT